jgi:hypothetical protein
MVTDEPSAEWRWLTMGKCNTRSWMVTKGGKRGRAVAFAGSAAHLCISLPFLVFASWSASRQISQRSGGACMNFARGVTVSYGPVLHEA